MSDHPTCQECEQEINPCRVYERNGKPICEECDEHLDNIELRESESDEEDED